MLTSGLYRKSEAVWEAEIMVCREASTRSSTRSPSGSQVSSPRWTRDIASEGPDRGGTWVMQATVDAGENARCRGALHVMLYASKRVCEAIMQHGCGGKTPAQQEGASRIRR